MSSEVKIKLKNSKAGFGKSNIVMIGKYNYCNKCDKTNKVALSCDSSDGEYGDICLCVDCLKEIIQQMEQIQ